MNTTATATCWNCRQPLQAGAATCLWCGVSQQAPATQFVLAPGGAPAGQGPSGVAVLAAPAPTATPPSAGLQAPRGAFAPQPSPSSGQRQAREPIGLPAAFRGKAAGTGARLGAFSIDAVAVLGASAGVAIAASSPMLGSLAALEAVVFLWVLEARTGLTVGNALLRVRTSRADTPFSPGVGRALIRNVVIGAGFVGAALGAWVVVGSSAWDPARRGRGWADLASRTQSVAVPRRERSAATVAGALSASAPHVIQHIRAAGRIEPHVSGLGASRVVPSLARVSGSIDDSMALSQTGVGPVAGAAIEQTAPPVVAAPAAPVVAAAPPVPVAPVAIPPAPGLIATVPGIVHQAPAAAHTAPSASAAPSTPTTSAATDASGQSTLLLVFDTGQREQLPLPTVVNLGRKPAASEPSDRLIAVKDPEGTVSKTHVRLEHSRGRTWVTDTGSTNGTELLEDDGDVITLAAGQRTAVDNGVRVRIGNRAFTISVLVDGNSNAGVDS